MSKMSMKVSGGLGAMFWRAGPGGTETPKFPVTGVMSKMSEYVSWLRSPGQGAQERAQRPVSLVMSKMSMKVSGGTGAIFWRAGPGGTDRPKLAVTGVMSKMSEYWSLLKSAGQAL